MWWKMPFKGKDIQFYQKPMDMSNKTRVLHGSAALRGGFCGSPSGSALLKKKILHD
jgi:hypothetical protein